MKINLIRYANSMDPNAPYLKDSEQFLEDINNELFEDDLELVEGVEDPIYSIIFIETGGSEQKFIKDVDNLKLPIKYYVVTEHQKCVFYVTHNNEIYVLTIKAVDLEK